MSPSSAAAAQLGERVLLASRRSGARPGAARRGRTPAPGRAGRDVRGRGRVHITNLLRAWRTLDRARCDGQARLDGAHGRHLSSAPSRHVHRRFTSRTRRTRHELGRLRHLRGHRAPATPPARSEHVPVTPEQIADSAIEAARAGAAVVHIHVRDPRDRQGRARPGALPRGRRADPRRRRRRRAQPDRRHGRRPRARRRGFAAAARSRRAPTWPARPSGSRTSPSCGPEICTLDCGTMNFAAGGDYVMVNTPGDAARDGRARPGAGRAARARGVRHRPPGLRPRADRATA